MVNLIFNHDFDNKIFTKIPELRINGPNKLVPVTVRIVESGNSYFVNRLFTRNYQIIVSNHN